MVNETNKVRVLIYPVENGQYAADCLDLNTFTIEPTREKAAQTITDLIDDHVLTGLELKIPYERLRQNAHQRLRLEYVQAYSSAESFPHSPSLSPEIQNLVREIEYRYYPNILPD